MNRYSYVLNNPINASDPSGHKCTGEPEECLDDDGTLINGSGGWGTSVGGGGNEDLLKSVVVIIFGKKGKSDETTLPVQDDLSRGLGGAIDNNVVKTAEHVYGNRPPDTDIVLVISYDGGMVIYTMAEVIVITGPGDTATITFPRDLPESVVPTTEAANYDYSAVSQPVGTIHADRVTNDEGKVTGYEFHFMTTVTSGVDRIIRYGNQLVIKDSDDILVSGDSGAPVYNNNQLIGVISEEGPGISTVAPLCFQPSSPWESLLAIPPKPCGVP